MCSGVLTWFWARIASWWNAVGDALVPGSGLVMEPRNLPRSQSSGVNNRIQADRGPLRMIYQAPPEEQGAKCVLGSALPEQTALTRPGAHSRRGVSRHSRDWQQRQTLRAQQVLVHREMPHEFERRAFRLTRARPDQWFPMSLPFPRCVGNFVNGEGGIAEQIAMEVQGSKYCHLVDIELAGCGLVAVGLGALRNPREGLSKNPPLVPNGNSKSK